MYRRKQLLSSEKVSLRLKFGYSRDVTEVAILPVTVARIPWTVDISMGHSAREPNGKISGNPRKAEIVYGNFQRN